MNTSPSIDSRIAALAPDVSEDLRRELQGALNTLRDADQPISVILTLSRLSLLLLDKIFAAVGESRPSDNLWNCILRASTGNEKNPKIEGLGILPRTLKENLDTIRKWSNPADHADQSVPVPTSIDAENALGMFLRVVEWFYCEFEKGPRLPTIYTEAWRPVTLHQRFAELQDASAEQSRSVEAEIARLHETLRRQSERAQETTRDPVPIPLPTLRGTFVDREVERDTLHHLLREGEMRLVVIVAPGGYGKTELTTKILKEVAPSTSIIDPSVHGILYLRCLRGDLSLGRIFAEAGRIVGARESFQQTYASRDLTLERKLEFFFSELSQGGNVWVVMDNFEDLLAADDSIVDADLRAFVEAAVATEHNVRLIATTRAVPLFKGSQRLKPIDLREGLPEEQAVKYLRTEGADYGLADAEEELLRAFVNRVHRIPKALESVVGYLSEKYPIVQLPDLMATDALFADFDRYDMENGLRHLIAEQFTDQTPDAQLVLCALSVFPKPASLAALRYLLPALDWASVLPRLERNRLVSRQGDRYDLHPLVREYAYEQIPEDTLDADLLINESDVTEDGTKPSGTRTESQEDVASSAKPATSPISGVVFTRFALHARVADFFKAVRAPQSQWKTIADLEPQLDEFYHRVRARQYDDAARVLRVIDSNYLQLWGHSRTLIELREQLEGKLTDKFLSHVNAGSLGNSCRDSGQFRKAISYYERALQRAQNDNNQNGVANALGGLGNAYIALSETQRALEYYEQSLTIFRGVGDRKGEGTVLCSLGTTYSALGETQRAVEFYTQALALSREIGDRGGEGYALSNLGITYSDFGETQRAIEYLEEALAISREIRQRISEGGRLCNLGSVYSELGEEHRAIEYLEQALSIFREIGDPRGEGRTLGSLGNAYYRLGETHRAIGYYDQALAIRREIGDRGGEGGDLSDLGAAYYDLGETQRAIEYCEQALVIGREIGDRSGEGVALSNLGEAITQLGDFELSTRYYNDALKIGRDIGHKFGISYRLAGLGHAYHYLNDLPEARRCYAEAFALDLPTTNYSCAIRLGILGLEENKTADAEDYFTRGITLCRALLEKTPRLYGALYTLALAQLGSGQPDEAIATYRQALEVCAAKGVVQSALQDLALLKRVPKGVAGLEEAEALLLEAIEQA